MLNKEKHQMIMGEILRDIYANVAIASLLGFKGGTCAYFFYGLPRFSVDLDFDLLAPTEENQKMVFENIQHILRKYGKIKDSYIKRFTVFALLSYGEEDHNIKVEINVRTLMANIKDQYEPKEYLGIPMLVAKKEYLFGSKLVALTSRSTMAMRDIYDICYFAKNRWDIDQEIIQSRTGKHTKEYLADCIDFLEKVENTTILQGLGELLGEKEKIWVKEHVKTDTIFMLKNYKSVLGE